MIKIAASILDINFIDLEQEIKKTIEAGSDMIHLDIMDGIFAPDITFKPDVVKSLPQNCPADYDVHLVVKKPENHIQTFMDLGYERLTFHIEATLEPMLCLRLIKGNKGETTLAINPATPISTVNNYLEELDAVLVMTVEPGIAGQDLVKSTIPKIEQLKEVVIKRGLSTIIKADGGINKNNLRRLIDAGLDIAVVGAAIYDLPDYALAIKELKNQ